MHSAPQVLLKFYDHRLALRLLCCLRYLPWLTPCWDRSSSTSFKKSGTWVPTRSLYQSSIITLSPRHTKCDDWSIDSKHEYVHPTVIARELSLQAHTMPIASVITSFTSPFLQSVMPIPKPRYSNPLCWVIILTGSYDEGLKYLTVDPCGVQTGFFSFFCIDERYLPNNTQC